MILHPVQWNPRQLLNIPKKGGLILIAEGDGDALSAGSPRAADSSAITLCCEMATVYFGDLSLGICLGKG